MTAQPVVSVVVPTYHRRAELRRALASIAAQGVEGVEVVVVNDAGCDVADVVDEVRDRLAIQQINLVSHRGLAVTRKIGICAARGQSLAFLDDDDVWLPGHLATALAGLHTAGTDMVYTTCLVAHEPYDPSSGEAVASRHQIGYPFDRNTLAVTNTIPVISVLTRPFDLVGLETAGAVQEDWALWLGLVLGRGWRAQHLPVVTTVYHRIPAACSMTGAAATSIDGIRRFAAGHRLLHERWPVEQSGPAGRSRWLPHHMYALVEARHTRQAPVCQFYYERSLPVIVAAVAGHLGPTRAKAALAEAVVPGGDDPSQMSATLVDTPSASHPTAAQPEELPV
jgi:glycosyltransferase involved in cell wall biosynthesis